MVILEGAIDALGAASLVVPDVLWPTAADVGLALFLLNQVLLERGVASRVDGDDRHMSQ